MTAPVRSSPARVLVVDDSALVRDLVPRLLERHRRLLSVAVAADPIIARRKIAEARPDVILLDLAMPRMDGLSFLRILMAEDPIPVVVFSSRVGKDTDDVFRALDLGAIDVVAKPQIGMQDFLAGSVASLVETLLAAAGAKVPRRRVPRFRSFAPAALFPAASAKKGGPRDRAVTAPKGETAGGLSVRRLIAIGASTGGTEALGELLAALPPETPGIAIVQHMPEGFTAAFARRLDVCSRMEVKEAVSGDRLCRGRVLVAPGNRHLVLRRAGDEYVAELVNAPPVSRHRPSVDVLFRSVADAAGDAAVGVILTGMGSDGAEGLLAMKARGARTIAQDEASCVVFGMPREAIARGGVDEVMTLSRIAAALVNGRAGDGHSETNGMREGVR
jgi:two-component system chemotaxis response regulator CheB